MCDCGCNNCRCDGCKDCKCSGVLLGLLGVLILINLFVWPKWLGVDGWLGFFALLMIFGGVWKSAMSGCGCKCEIPKENHKDTPKEILKETSKESKKKK
ncbi:MAG: hypothetical protein ACP5OA_00450 [Candidatus Woesearchaeota archaeon]